MNAAATLRALLRRDELLVCPLVSDALSARLAQQAGLPCALMGGFTVAAVRFALPDTGLITFSDMLDHLRAMADAVPGYPIIADGDTGYGNAMNVRRTVEHYARAGAAGVLIEDQVWPKQCGHYGGARQVIPRDEARMKIRAAVEARGDGEIVIVARTDARAAYGLDEALARCAAFVEEGADVVFIEALQTADEMRTFASAFPATWANMMPKTPVLSRAELRSMGYRIVTYNVAFPAAVRAMQDAFAALAADDAARLPPLLPFEELTMLVGLDDYLATDQRYRT